MSNVQALPRAAPLHRGIIDIGASSHVWVHVDGRRHRLQRRGRNHHVVEAVTSSSPTVDLGNRLREFWESLVGTKNMAVGAPRENAILVIGAAGRIGNVVVKKLVESGRAVVAPMKSVNDVKDVFKPIAWSSGKGTLRVEDDIDGSEISKLTPELFEGVTQVVSVVSPQADASSERIQAQGNRNIAEAAAEFLPKIEYQEEEILSMRTAADLDVWERLDDVIMGGKSSSSMAPSEDGSGFVWSGELIVEGGGFCGYRASLRGMLDLSEFDGVTFRVKGNGSIFKMNLKTAQTEKAGKLYQASFDTVDGDWTTVKIPWNEFVPVQEAMYEPSRPPLDPSEVSGITLVYSRFTYNWMPNPKYSPGRFELQVEGGISVFRDVRPQLIMLSSAAVERNAIIADDAVARENDIPIVKLNPGGILNHLYTGENAVRGSGVPYAIVRSTGLRAPEELEQNLIECDQGDQLLGTITNEDVANVIVQALDSPAAAYKTFEIRRSKDPQTEGKVMGDKEYQRMFLKLALDRNRWRVGLPPFPPPYVLPSSSTDKEEETPVNAEGGNAGNEGEASPSDVAVPGTANVTA